MRHNAYESGRSLDMYVSKLVARLLMLCSLLYAATALAAPSMDKPFADTKVVLQISDLSPAKQNLVLNVAQNLLNHYGPDRVDVEVVAFGPGLRLLFADNANKERVDMLAQNGVRFSACGNTIHSFTKQLGYAPKINPVATVVPGGVVRIVDLVHQGYVLDKP